MYFYINFSYDITVFFMFLLFFRIFRQNCLGKSNTMFLCLKHISGNIISSNIKDELLGIVFACKRSSQSQFQHGWQRSSWDSNLRTKELLATVGCWRKESNFSVCVAMPQWMAPPVYIWPTMIGLRGWKDGSVARNTYSSFKGLSLTPNTHTVWLITISNPSSREICNLWPPWAPALTCTYSHRHTHMCM